jgi:phosphoglycolate phosphatase
MIEALIIDVDDTLCLTEAACFDMENETLAAIGREAMPRELHIRTWGQPLFEAMLTRSPGVDIVAFRAAYQPIIAEYTNSGKLDTIPDVNYEALDKLLTMGKLLLVLTSRTHDELKHMLEPDHQLAERIKAFYCKDNTQYHKPDPRAFNELLENSGLRPENCAYVGDSTSDAIATKQAGIHFIASLESGLRQREDFFGLTVDIFVDKFPDVVDAIADLDGSTPSL